MAGQARLDRTLAEPDRRDRRVGGDRPAQAEDKQREPACDAGDERPNVRPCRPAGRTERDPGRGRTRIVADVVLVEDNVALRKSLADCLTVLGHKVTEAGDAAELYRLLGTARFDVAVVDVNLPHHSGYSITQYLSQQTGMAVIITTVREAVEDRVEAYRSGADIYMPKPVEPEELSAAITRLAARLPAAAAPDAAARHDGADAWTYDPATLRLDAPDGASARLTRREGAFIEHLLRSGREVVSRAEIITALGETDDEAARGRLDVRLSRLRAKVLAATGRSLPLLTAHSAGFSLTAPIRLRRG